MKPTVKILFVLLAALLAQTASAQDNVCPPGGIIYQHGNLIGRDLDGDISEQEVQAFQERGLRFRVHPAHLAGPHGETGRYRTVTLKAVFGTANNGGPSRVLEFSIPDETNRTAFVGTSPWSFELRNLGDGYFHLYPDNAPLYAPRMIYTGDVCFYQAEQPQR